MNGENEKNNENNWMQLDKFCEMLKRHGLPFDHKDIKLTPNEPRHSKVYEASSVFFDMVIESNGTDDIRVRMDKDPLTHTALEVTVAGDIISFNNPKILADFIALADNIEIVTKPKGESEIGFSFENVWN